MQPNGLQHPPLNPTAPYAITIRLAGLVLMGVATHDWKIPKKKNWPQNAIPAHMQNRCTVFFRQRARAPWLEATLDGGRRAPGWPEFLNLPQCWMAPERLHGATGDLFLLELEIIVLTPSSFEVHFGPHSVLPPSPFFQRFFSDIFLIWFPFLMIAKWNAFFDVSNVYISIQVWICPIITHFHFSFFFTFLLLVHCLFDVNIILFWFWFFLFSIGDIVLIEEVF